MEISRIDEFRRYYNSSIHPELVRMERLRLRLLLLTAGSVAVLFGLFLLLIYLNLAFITLFVSIPVVFYLAYLGYRMQRFRQTFKPRIVRLILEFMNEALNYRELRYDDRGKISKARFLRSGIFKTDAPYYEGEDYIVGLVGEMPFEMSELSVREISPASNKLQDIFEGIFIYAVFAEEDSEGEIVVWPRRRKHTLTRSIKEFTWNGGGNVDHEIMNAEFRELFLVYATPDTHVIGLLPEEMQEALVQWVRLTGKDIYISFIDRDIYCGVSEPNKDLLEPHIFSSNLNFDLIREFYLDISQVLQIIRIYDQTH